MLKLSATVGPSSGKKVAVLSLPINYREMMDLFFRQRHEECQESSVESIDVMFPGPRVTLTLNLLL